MAECKQKSKLSDGETIRQLLKKLNADTQQQPGQPGFAPEAVAVLVADIAELEKEYDGMAELVAGYEKVYPDLQKPGTKYCEAERQFQGIRKWVDDVKVGSFDATKKAIDDLRSLHYRDETEEPPPLPDTHPKKLLEKAQQAFRIIKSCFDQRKEEEEEAKAEYTKTKAFQSTAEKWFTDLGALYKEAQDYLARKNYKSLYATYIEAEQVWNKIKKLSPSQTPTSQTPTSQTPTSQTTPSQTTILQDPEWFRTQLIEKLKKWLIAKHERFLWHDDWLKWKQGVSDAQKVYDDFTTNRRKNFRREAEDVVGKADGGGYETETRAA